MLSPSQKKLALTLGVSMLIVGAFSIFATKRPEDRKPVLTASVQSAPVTPASSTHAVDSSTPSSNGTTSSTDQTTQIAPYNELVSNTAQGQTIRNTACSSTFVIPSNWSVDGLFGSSVIRSAEDRRTNEEWDKTHQDLIQHEEGDAPLGPDARNLVFGCVDNIDAYKKGMSGLVGYSDFENARNLAEVVASSPFHSNDLGLALVKTIKINGQDAYEISETGRGGDGVQRTFYDVVLEKGRIFDFTLDFTEYDKLSDAAKQIIQSISFDK